jgi:hypothetical protein
MEPVVSPELAEVDLPVEELVWEVLDEVEWSLLPVVELPPAPPTMSDDDVLIGFRPPVPSSSPSGRKSWHPATGRSATNAHRQRLFIYYLLRKRA